MLKWLRTNRPSVRELLWFALWIVVIAAVFRAGQLFTYKSPAEPESPPTKRIALNLNTDTVVPLTTSRAKSAPQIVAPPPVQSPPKDPIKVEPPPPPPPSPHRTFGTAQHPKAWAPDHESDKGDARIAYADEVTWLQEQLEKVQITKAVAAEFQLSHVGLLTKQVGAIPYEMELHGWGLPEQTLARNVGDCQDKSLLLATKLIASGIREVAICRGVPPNYKPGEPGHAWVQAMVNGVLWRMEATNGEMTRANSGSKLDAFEAVVTVWNLVK